MVVQAAQALCFLCSCFRGLRGNSKRRGGLRTAQLRLQFALHLGEARPRLRDVFARSHPKRAFAFDSQPRGHFHQRLTKQRFLALGFPFPDRLQTRFDGFDLRRRLRAFGGRHAE